MIVKLKLFLLLYLPCISMFGQHNQSGILKTILATYYKNEKPIVKGRAQFLFLFCDKANNNEELFETIGQLKLSAQETAMLKSRVNTDKTEQNWSGEISEIAQTPANKMLLSKVNECLSLETFQTKQKQSNFNNQRLLIISKPVFYTDGKTALVKVVFYRSIEHNYGSILLMKKVGENWQIAEQLNPWET